MRALFGIALGLGLAVPGPVVAQGGLNDITIISVDIGHFEFGNRFVHIFENSRNQIQNKANVAQWRFSLEPIFAPLSGKNGCVQFLAIESSAANSALVVAKARNIRTDRPEAAPLLALHRNRVMIPLSLTNSNSRAAALAAIGRIYPEAKAKLGLENIDVLPLSKLELSIPDLEDRSGPLQGTVKLVNKSQSFISAPKNVYLIFDVIETTPGKTDENLMKFIGFFPYLSISADVSFSVKGATYNIIDISRDDLKETELLTSLEGKGGLMYVTRSDLRELSQKVVSQMRTTVILEDPATFSESLFQKMFNSTNRIEIDLANFDQQRKEKTYNTKDLDPNVIERFFKEEFQKERNIWSRKHNVQTGGGGSFLGIIKANGHGNYSDDQFKDYLKEHGLKVDIKGNNIIPKSVEVHEVNTAAFTASVRQSMEVRKLSQVGPKTNLPMTIYGMPVGDDGQVINGSCKSETVAEVK